jgi:hypothetical protein
LKSNQEVIGLVQFNIGATRRTNTAFVLLAAATKRGKQKTLHIVMACEPVFLIVIGIKAEHAVQRSESD